MNDVSGGKPGASCGTSAELLRALESQSVVLEGQQFELLMSELNFDMKSWGVYTRKLGEFDLRVATQKDAWMTQRHARAKQAAEAVLDAKAVVY